MSHLRIGGTGTEVNPEVWTQLKGSLHTCPLDSPGKEIPRGNHGDIGREKKRVAKKWFSKKYYSSVLNLRDFLADNIGQSFVGVVAKALDDNYRRYNH